MAKRKRETKRAFNPRFSRPDGARIDRAARTLGISGYRFVQIAAVEMARRVNREPDAEPRGG